MALYNTTSLSSYLVTAVVEVVEVVAEEEGYW
jgi:hypothetical protein